MSKKYTTVLALGAAVMLIMSACAANAVQDGALQPTGGNPTTTVASLDDDGHNDATQDAAVQPTAGNPTTTVASHDDDDGHNDAASATDADRVVEVELSEFAITAAANTFAPGETVEFVVTNSGVVEHEFRLSNQHRVDEHIASGHADHAEGAMSDEEMAAMDDDGDGDAHEDAGHGGEPVDAVLVVAAGETASMTFTFPENTDDYTVQACLIPGHYEAGMATDLSYNA